MNKLTIIGNLTRDPELRTTTEGINVCNMDVAVNRRKTARNQDPGADYFHVSVWRGLGESCAKYLTKGAKVAVIGAVSVREWETQNGRHGASLEVTAEDVEFLSGNFSRDEKPAPQPAAQPATPPADAQGGFTAVETDELPF